ncbi:hypothetical protein DYST_02755 [Dyella terrae]|nr:hypothetical protein DYST_02755 [Dyella terrae]
MRASGGLGRDYGVAVWQRIGFRQADRFHRSCGTRGAEYVGENDAHDAGT